jgi:hypothetical protein
MLACADLEAGGLEDAMSSISLPVFMVVSSVGDAFAVVEGRSGVHIVVVVSILGGEGCVDDSVIVVRRFVLVVGLESLGIRLKLRGGVTGRHWHA